MTVSLSRLIEGIAELSKQADHIQKTMTSPNTGEKLDYERAKKLLVIAMEAINERSAKVMEIL